MDNEYNLIWWELNPYVHRQGNRSDVDSITGFIYNVFLDSLAECSATDLADHHGMSGKFAQHFLVNGQSALLERIADERRAVGMPVILETSSLRDAPPSFVRVLSTIGLTWLYHHDPPMDSVLWTGLASVWPILCVVIIFTGYAALLIWLAERSVRPNNYFNRRFHLGILDSYWYAFVSATTVGYGDKVPQSIVGKLVAMIWILCGLCSTAVFTAGITTFFTSLTEGSALVAPPLHDVQVGVVNSSIDFRLVAERGAQPIEYGNVENLTLALMNHDVDSIALDPNVYCVIHEQFNFEYEFRMGATSPTAVGYIFNHDNATLLQCMKTAAFYLQGEFDQHLKELYETVKRPGTVEQKDDNLIGKEGTWYILYAAVGLLALYAAASLADFFTSRFQPSHVTLHSVTCK